MALPAGHSGLDLAVLLGHSLLRRRKRKKKRGKSSVKGTERLAELPSIHDPKNVDFHGQTFRKRN